MARRKHAVQFQHIAKDGRTDTASLLIEQLRYAGLVHIVSEKPAYPDQADDERTAYLLQIRCPSASYNDAVWARQQVERMASFGINAVDVFVD